MEEEKGEIESKLLEVEMKVSSARVDIEADFGEEMADKDLKGVRRQLERLVASEDAHRSNIESLEADLTTLESDLAQATSDLRIWASCKDQVSKAKKFERAAAKSVSEEMTVEPRLKSQKGRRGGTATGEDDAKPRRGLRAMRMLESGS